MGWKRRQDARLPRHQSAPRKGQRVKSVSKHLDKLAVARAQLGTATYLFLNDLDPISVQCLACGGGEIVDALAAQAEARPVSVHIIANMPSMDSKAVKAVRNRYWNAFKHLTAFDGSDRDDTDLLGSFDDTANDTALFVAWTDYGRLTGQLPIAGQVIQLWWCCLHKDRFVTSASFQPELLFPKMTGFSRSAQKAMLRAAVAKYERDADLLANPATEVWPPIPTRA